MQKLIRCALAVAGWVLMVSAVGSQNLHQPWDNLLRKHVSTAGKVNYRGFQQDKKVLDAYLSTLANTPVEGLPRSAQLAYLLNLYNAATVQLIVEHYPLKSITQLHGGKPWDVKRIAVGARRYSLNEVENDIIRPRFREPRIHFALNCAAKSCPTLWNRAYTPQNLEKVLTERTRVFLRDRQANVLSKDEVQVSKIFEWYAADFGDLIAFLNQYGATKVQPKASVGYLPYDWSLNE